MQNTAIPLLLLSIFTILMMLGMLMLAIKVNVKKNKRIIGDLIKSGIAYEGKTKEGKFYTLDKHASYLTEDGHDIQSRYFKDIDNLNNHQIRDFFLNKKDKRHELSQKMANQRNEVITLTYKAIDGSKEINKFYPLTHSSILKNLLISLNYKNIMLFIFASSIMMFFIDDLIDFTKLLFLIVKLFSWVNNINDISEYF